MYMAVSDLYGLLLIALANLFYSLFSDLFGLVSLGFFSRLSPHFSSSWATINPNKPHFCFKSLLYNVSPAAAFPTLADRSGPRAPTLSPRDCNPTPPWSMCHSLALDGSQRRFLEVFKWPCAPTSLEESFGVRFV